LDSGFFRILRAFNDYDRHGLLPVAGGTEDQTPEFREAVLRIGADRDWLADQFPADP
jgi:hypothetical protein